MKKEANFSQGCENVEIEIDSLKRPLSAIFVLRPEILISATSVADASPCIRKPLLASRYSQVCI